MEKTELCTFKTFYFLSFKNQRHFETFQPIFPTFLKAIQALDRYRGHKQKYLFVFTIMDTILLALPIMKTYIEIEQRKKRR